MAFNAFDIISIVNDVMKLHDRYNMIEMQKQNGRKQFNAIEIIAIQIDV